MCIIDVFNNNYQIGLPSLSVPLAKLLPLKSCFIKPLTPSLSKELLIPSSPFSNISLIPKPVLHFKAVVSISSDFSTFHFLARKKRRIVTSGSSAAIKLQKIFLNSSELYDSKLETSSKYSLLLELF